MQRAGYVIGIFGTVIISSALQAEPPRFRRHIVNVNSTNCACAVLDVDADGKLDIVAGDLWYQAPKWDQHPVREVEQIRGRPDDYSNLTWDVNKDGFVDLISCNYRSQSIYWIQNPGPKATKQGATWIKHEIAKPGPMETGRLADVDADGRLDVLPNGTQFAAWWDLEPGAEPKWTRYSLPEELAGHGLGFGDINGDGRNDVIGARGWAEAPEDRRNGRWVFHQDFDLWKGASIPILVEDVDGDGDNDLIWGRGHRFGLYWMEQMRNAEGQRQWTRHAIDTSWSQPHSLLWGDLDGDKKPELIAGSRYLGHDGKDPGEYNPLVIASYEFIPETRSWGRYVISTGQNIGFGLDPKMTDLDGDNDLDLICPGRSGLYVIENLLKNSTNASESEAVSVRADDYDHTDVFSLKEVGGHLRPVTSPFDMGVRRSDILESMSLAMGPLPPTELRVPLDVEIHAEESAGKYIRRRISFSPEPGDRVPAWLLIPNDLKSPAAAMLCLHQTTGIGKGEPAGLGGLENLHYAHELAELGFVCLVPDYPSFGDYPYDFKVKGAHYGSGSMKAIWNNIRAIDLLESLSDVDPDRIGCIGHSLGGHNTLFTAAFDCRIRAVVTSCGFTAFHHYYGGNLAGWTSDRYMPRIRDIYANDPNKVPFDFYEVLAAIAPRSIFVNAPVSDDNFENQGVKKVVVQVEKVQKLYGEQGGAITARYPECGHDFPDEVRAEAYAWLKEQLK